MQLQPLEMLPKQEVAVAPSTRTPAQAGWQKAGPDKPRAQQAEDNLGGTQTMHHEVGRHS